MRQEQALRMEKANRYWPLARFIIAMYEVNQTPQQVDREDFVDARTEDRSIQVRSRWSASYKNRGGVNPDWRFEGTLRAFTDEYRASETLNLGKLDRLLCFWVNESEEMESYVYINVNALAAFLAAHPELDPPVKSNRDGITGFKAYDIRKLPRRCTVGWWNGDLHDRDALGGNPSMGRAACWPYDYPIM